MNPSLTIFTPTFNRAYSLHLCYESLIKQTNKDFIWLIIDDGSTDNTKDLIEKWKEQGKILIQYYYQDNQGMHGAHNTAYKNINTELNVCIDSDDYLADNAIEKILCFWKASGSSRYAGILGLDANPEGEVIGTYLPEHLKTSTFSELYGKHKVKGDKKLVYRSDITRNTPEYPLFEGEKYCPLSYKYILIDQEYPLLLMNEVLCHVEYRKDGSSMNMIHQYRKNPNGFSFFRKTAMKHAPTYKERLRESIHYVSSSLMIKNKKYLQDSPCKLTTLLATPFGLLLFLFIKNTSRSTVMKNG